MLSEQVELLTEDVTVKINLSSPIIICIIVLSQLLALIKLYTTQERE